MQRLSSLVGRCGLAVALLGGMPRAAQAQPRDAKTEAQALFQQGIEAANAGNCARAVPLFRRSQATYASRGTLLNLADCEVSLGRVASALAHFKEVVGQLPKGDPRLTYSERLITELEPRVPKLVLAVAPGAPRPSAVLLDQAALPDLGLGAELLVDPVDHVIVAKWADGRESEISLSIAEGERKVVPLAAPIRPRLEPSETSTAPLPPAAPDRASGNAPVLAFAIGGAGLALLGGSLVLGGIGAGVHSDLRESCPTPARCNQDGVDLAARGEALTTASTVFGLVGAVGIGAGVVLYLTRPARRPSVDVALAVRPGGGAALVQGRF